MGDYDIADAFSAIEQELIASMIRNLDRHRAEETDLGIEWSQWQIEQLRALEKYKVSNQKKYGKQFKSINAQIGEMMKLARQTGNMEQEIEILRAIKNGFKGYKRSGPAMTGEFFKLNDRKLEALVKATTDDMKKAETAVLRMSNDKYRKAIFNAQVYANSGAGTYEKAVDMATKDMLKAGLNCIEYANGARHTLSDYADMAIRTANKRAYLQGEGEKRKEWGISTVIMNKRGNPCPKCLPFVGKVLIDDVWSGGNSKDGDYPLMSHAVSKGLYHPRCKDSHTTYFEGISEPPDDKFTQKEINEIEKVNKEEAKQQYANRQIEKYERLSRYSLDPENKNDYGKKAKEWRDELQEVPEWKRIMHEPLREFSEEELREMANEADRMAAKHINKQGKWSGEIIVNPSNNIHGKLWNCDISTMSETSPHILLHEQLHARSISYHDLDTYIKYANIEEATVQFMTQEISRVERVEIIGSAYDDLADALRMINHKAKITNSDYDFAKQLIEIPLPQRLDWLEDKISDIMNKNGTIEEYQELSGLINLLC